MKKVNIIGTSGSGKSTFGRRLANALNYPFIQLDELYWLDDWAHEEDEAFFAKLEQVLSQPTWVLDGNYSRTQPIKWRDADTVIWLNYSFSTVLFRAMKRAVTRIITREKLWGTNNSETLRKLLSHDSILLWTIKTHHKNRKKYRQIQTNPAYAKIDFIVLKSPHDAEQFLSKLST